MAKTIINERKRSRKGVNSLETLINILIMKLKSLKILIRASSLRKLKSIVEEKKIRVISAPVEFSPCTEEPKIISQMIVAKKQNRKIQSI